MGLELPGRFELPSSRLQDGCSSRMSFGSKSVRYLHKRILSRPFPVTAFCRSRSGNAGSRLRAASCGGISSRTHDIGQNHFLPFPSMYLLPVLRGAFYPISPTPKDALLGSGAAKSVQGIRSRRSQQLPRRRWQHFHRLEIFPSILPQISERVHLIRYKSLALPLVTPTCRFATRSSGSKR